MAQLFIININSGSLLPIPQLCNCIQVSTYSLEFVKQTQQILNGHCSMWLKIFLVGLNWGHEDRHRETKINNSLSVSPLYLLYKDHKGWSFGMPGEPPSRPIAATKSSQNVHFSEMISQVVEPICSEFLYLKLSVKERKL